MNSKVVLSDQKTDVSPQSPFLKIFVRFWVCSNSGEGQNFTPQQLSHTEFFTSVQLFILWSYSWKVNFPLEMWCCQSSHSSQVCFRSSQDWSLWHRII